MYCVINIFFLKLFNKRFVYATISLCNVIMSFELLHVCYDYKLIYAHCFEDWKMIHF